MSKKRKLTMIDNILENNSSDKKVESKNIESTNLTKRQRLEQRIIYYIENLEDSPEQKTPEWYAIKQTTIGGSEIATAIGKNPYESPFGLIRSKKIDNFTGNDATTWGTIMEDVTKNWAEIICNC